MRDLESRLDGEHQNAKATDWDLFLTLSKKNSMPSPLFTSFSRFNARFRAARCMSVKMRGYNKITSDGYEALLKSAMAYSALEALGLALAHAAKPDAIKPPQSIVSSLPVISASVAAKFRDPKSERLRSQMLPLVNSQLREKLNEIANDCLNPLENDVNPLAAAIRHMVFHGHFSPGSIGFGDGKWIPELLGDLYCATVSETDKHFSDFVKSQSS